ncbi:antifungal protein ginkbilobin-like protein [Prosopis cineraria]|uniref:antifungal protein ginkbilobin-like protein n=1 Tax=Prosopis cineraria TaxID=364024 RepID=UPI00241038E9|nr:antifungal protein ginkbilobin-like protein [Prosopis cineraria]
MKPHSRTATQKQSAGIEEDGGSSKIGRNRDCYGDPFDISLAYVVQDPETVTPSRQDHDYYNISPYPNAFAYGHAACNPNLTASDCRTCLAAAKTAMFGACQKRRGARAVLHDCTIRHEQYPFDD